MPYDNAGYLDIAPLDKGENVRRQICFTLEQMEMTPLSSHHERGPGQNEIDFMYSDSLTAADNFSMFKAMVKTIANSNGLFASFMPKPLDDKNGNSMHINVMIERYGYNIFKKKDGELNTTAGYFIVCLKEFLRLLLSLILSKTHISVSIPTSKVAVLAGLTEVIWI